MQFTPLNSLVSYPLLFWAFQNAICILIIGFTSPTSVVRLSALPPIVAGVWYILPHISSSTKYPLWAGLLGAGILSSVLQYTEVALSSKWSFKAHGPTLTPAQEQISRKRPIGNGTAEKKVEKKISEIPGAEDGGSVLERLRFGYYAMFSNRHCGTLYEVKNVPVFSHKDPTHVPSRRSFLLRKAVMISLCYLILDLVTLAIQSAPVEAEGIAPAFDILEKRNFLAHLIQFQFIPFLKRMVLTACFWFVSRCFIQTFYNISAFLRVACGLDSVEFWRPNFGPLSDAYSVRQFWSVSWHQHIRLKLAAIPNLVVYGFLTLRKGAIITRYVHLLLVFLTSGILHTGIDISSGIALEHSPALGFFLTQAAGIMFEDGVQAIYRAMTGRKSTRWQRYAGYVWLLVFLTWSSQQKIRKSKMDNRGEVLPFRVVQPILNISMRSW